MQNPNKFPHRCCTHYNEKGYDDGYVMLPIFRVRICRNCGECQAVWGRVASGEAGAGYWWRLFGFRREIPDRLVIRIASALPRQCTSGVSDNLDGLCGRGVTVPFDPQEPEGDCVELHTIFFDDVDPGDGHPNQLRNFTSTFHDWPEKPD